MKALTAAEMQEVDRLAIEAFAIPSLVLMENAGRKSAEAAAAMAGGRKIKVACVCGKGNNGGDGFVCARHLVNYGLEVEVFLAGGESGLTNDARVNLSILKKMGVNIPSAGPEALGRFDSQIREADLIIDAIFGIGLRGPARGHLPQVIAAINRSNKKVLAIDIPSGLDATEGTVLGSCVKADKTVTFAAAKTGLLKNRGPEFCGEIIVADISIPKQILTNGKL